MKRVAVLVLGCILMTGCASGENSLDVGMELRSKLINAEEVSFHVDIAVDHGETLDLFSMECKADKEGKLSFSVTAPDTISGITGQLSSEKGTLSFDETVLYFPLVAENSLSPISAPWILMKALRSGYLRSAGVEEDQIRLTVDDSYEDDALQVDIWLDEYKLPQKAEVLCQGRLILSLEVRNFEVL